MDPNLSAVELKTDGRRPTIIKAAEGPGRDRLQYEATMLAAARHPGVVALVEPGVEQDSTGRWLLKMHFAGSRTLATLGSPAPARAAGLLAALATTVADLHDLGIYHGRLTGDHVIVASDGRPVICGFAEAGQLATKPHWVAADVAALGRLLQDLLRSTADMVEPAPSRRWIGRRHDGLNHRGPLLNLADQATADDPQRRPTARQLAAAISETVPEATLHTPTPQATPAPAHSSPGWFERLGPSGSRGLLPLGTGLALVAALASGLMLAGRGSSSEAQPDRANPPLVSSVTSTPRERAREVTTTSSPTTTSTIPPPTAAADPFQGCSVVEGQAPTAADGTPCSGSLSLAGSVLSLGDEAFDLGVSRAAVALGDFACAGPINPAVVDLDSGDVFVFDGWAQPTQPVTIQAIKKITAPRQILAESSPDGCHRLVVLDSWGIRHVVELTKENS